MMTENTGASSADTGSVDTSTNDDSSSFETNSDDEGQGDQSQGSKAATAALKEKFKLTVDGEEIEEELDWNDKETIKRKLQLARAADKRMSEAKAAKQKAFEIVQAFEKDAASILKRLGPKGREAAEKYLLEQIEDEMLTPEQKQERMDKAELAALRAEKEKAKKDAEDAKAKEIEAHYANSFQQTIISALDKSGLPKTPKTVKDMAALMMKNLDQGLELTAEELSHLVKNDVSEQIKALIKDADGDQLLALFGEEIANKIRKSDLRKLTEKQNTVFQSKTFKGTSTASKSTDSGLMTMDQWKAQVNSRIK